MPKKKKEEERNKGKRDGKTFPIQKVYIRGKENCTSSNMRKKARIPKDVDPNQSKIDGKPRQRIMRTSVKTNKKVDRTNTQNKRVWLKKRSNSATSEKRKKDNSLNIVKNTSIKQKKISIKR